MPELVELGSENVVLDCDYDYDEREKMELDIKWYFNDSPAPFFQWVPGQLKRPQVGLSLICRFSKSAALLPPHLSMQSI